MVKRKVVKITWSSWRKLRGMYPPIDRNERIIDYMDRVIAILKDEKVKD